MCTNITGDCNTDRPGMFDQAGRYKWDAWISFKGLSRDEDESKYIEKVNSLKK